MKSIIVSGIDGSGKSFLINKVAIELANRSKKSRVLWMRFQHYSVRLLHFASRILGLSVFDDRLNNWRHEFWRSRFFSWTYIIFTMIDVLIGQLKWRLIQKEEVLIFDRYINDVIIDLKVKTRIDISEHRFLNIVYRSVLPKNSVEVVLLRNKNDVLNSREENRNDKDFDFRYECYQTLSKQKNVVLVENVGPIDKSVNKIIALLC